MNCKDIKISMLDYLSEENIPQEMKDHFAVCPSCRSEFEQMQHLFQTLKPKIAINASQNFTKNIIYKLNKNQYFSPLPFQI